MNIEFLIILGVAAAGVVGIARSRGGNLAIWGSLPGAGILLMWWLAPVIGGPLDLSDRQAFWFFLSILWMGGCFFCARFLVGRSRETPGKMWVCRECKYLNPHYAQICEACDRPYSEEEEY